MSCAWLTHRRPDRLWQGRRPRLTTCYPAMCQRAVYTCRAQRGVQRWSGCHQPKRMEALREEKGWPRCHPTRGMAVMRDEDGELTTTQGEMIHKVTRCDGIPRHNGSETSQPTEMWKPTQDRSSPPVACPPSSPERSGIGSWMTLLHCRHPRENWVDISSVNKQSCPSAYSALAGGRRNRS